MTKPIIIPKALPQDTALSYDLLREEGIQRIQRMAGGTWIDHNTHFPVNTNEWYLLLKI